MTRDELIDLAESSLTECERVDFKSSLDVRAKAELLEVLKDLVAMANSGGGVIVVGVDDDGRCSACDFSGLLAYDPADLANQIHAHTGTHFGACEIKQISRSDGTAAAILVEPATVPLVFTTSGNYQTTDGRQKSAFTMGAVYMRHSAKSEPCTSDDLRQFIERRLDVIKQSWLAGIRKVVEAPPGAEVVVIPGGGATPPTSEFRVKITADETAPVHRLLDPNHTHPLRQKEVMALVAEKLGGKVRVNQHHLLAVRRTHQIELKPTFYYKGKFAAPQYSEIYVEWLVEEFNKDREFFDKAKRLLQLGAGSIPTSTDNPPPHRAAA